MISKIEHKGKLLAIIVRNNFKVDGLSFITDNDAILQMGLMKHPTGHKIIPHLHKPCFRTSSSTQEVIYLKSGKVKVDIYNSDKELITVCELEQGDWIILCDGGHGFEIIEEAVLVEVKNGPYAGDDDKEKF